MVTYPGTKGLFYITLRIHRLSDMWPFVYFDIWVGSPQDKSSGGGGWSRVEEFLKSDQSVMCLTSHG